MESNEVSLRKWLDHENRTVDRSKCLYIFRQVVDIVNQAHSRGIVVHNIRPSCFVMSSFNSISFIESTSSSSSSGSSENDDTKSRKDAMTDNISKCNSKYLQSNVSSSHTTVSLGLIYPIDMSLRDKTDEMKTEYQSRAEEGYGKRNKFPLKDILAMENNWYTSPEEVAGISSGLSSDIYRLGILLIELFCTFSSIHEKMRIMSNVRHRILPLQMLQKWPKEALFCQSLLHPQPDIRPTLRKLLQNDLLIEPGNDFEERKAAIKLEEDIEEQELLLEFLFQMQKIKQAAAENLHYAIRFLTSDISEVLKKKQGLEKKWESHIQLKNEKKLSIRKLDKPPSPFSKSCKRLSADVHSQSTLQFINPSVDGDLSDAKEKNILPKNSPLMRKLEVTYFSKRCKVMKRYSEERSIDNQVSKSEQREDGKVGWIDSFLDGLCKYLSYGKLRVRAELQQGNLVHSSNLICSMGFSRDEEFFAFAGVNKKIKVFECDSILNPGHDIHYPIVEMSSRSKLSSISWNGYIKNQIASSDFDGIVQVWDVSRGQVCTELREHEQRIWSIDFCHTDPTKLASGSNDGTVKLWNINQGASIASIKTKASVCCVQFPPDSSKSLAIGSADHKIYYFDLRNTKLPFTTLSGHTKTVSYVKFVNPTTIVSASTDNSLKLWDLTANNSSMHDSWVHDFTGHTNLKNFVGLSVSNEYIATGSETNEVFVYHKEFSMPIFSSRFCNMNPLSGEEIDDPMQFISCVCWRGNSTTLVTASSFGNIKFLEMV